MPTPLSIASCVSSSGSGIPTVVIEPGAEVLEHMSTDFMSEAASTEIVRALVPRQRHTNHEGSGTASAQPSCVCATERMCRD